MSDYYKCRSCLFERSLTDEDNRCAVVCSKCHTSFCLYCKDEGHFPASCSDAGYWNSMQSNLVRPRPTAVLKCDKWIRDKVSSIREEIESLHSLYRVHDDATLQQHPHLLQACNEMMKMMNIALWAYVSCLFITDLSSHDFMIRLSRVIRRCKDLRDKFPAAVVPPEPETPPRFGCVSCLVRQPAVVQALPDADPTYWDIKLQRNDAAEAVSELLSCFLKVYESPDLLPRGTPRAHMLQCLLSEMAFWDENHEIAWMRFRHWESGEF